MKLSTILIGLVFSIVVITGFMNFYATGVDVYGVQGYDNSSLVNLTTKLAEINNISIDVKEEIDSVEANPLIPDFLGVLLFGGVGAARTAVASVDVFIESVFIGSDLLPLGPLADVFILAIVTAIIIFFFIYILLHQYNKSDRL